MLHSITWLQFIKFILFGTLVYYGWVLITYYRQEITTRIKGEHKTKKTEDIEISAPGPVSTGQDHPDKKKLVPERKVTEEQSSELFNVMERAIALLNGIISEAVTNKIERTEILARIKEFLSSFHHLKRTPYQVAINNFLIRSWAPDFSPTLSDDDLEKLWN